MTPEVVEIGKRISDLRTSLDAHTQRLTYIQSTCKHRWEEVRYIPNVIPAYRVPGGSMGVDWRPGVDVPEEVIKIWGRTCLDCAHHQTTSRTKKEKSIAEGCMKEIEIPDFNSHHEKFLSFLDRH